FIWGAFGDKPGVTEPHWHRPGALLLGAPALLAAGSLIAGLAAPGLDKLISPYARSVPGALDSHLLLWHGFNEVLALTILIIAAGLVLFRFRGQIG
ncbi:Na+/H+ antiporter subunit A, partial [Nocardia cyriacigeorgica]|nr:Na+/H+ antiporter subunit A [Nocardia cyriacigeorgica]